MAWLSRSTMTAALAFAALLAAGATCAAAEDKEHGPCTEDAMLVFDASGSMAGNEGLGIATQAVTRIDKVRTALAKVLPSVTHLRRVGLITYGPGPYAQCNVHLSFGPKPDAAPLIMSEVNRLVPAGKTPLVSAVKQAADVLDYTKKPGVIVLLTDGEETCGGTPCDLGKFLHANAVQLTVHVIGYRVKGFSWTGEQSITDVKCLAEQNSGIYVAAQNEDELEQALEKTLGCPMLSQRARRRAHRQERPPCAGRATSAIRVRTPRRVRCKSRSNNPCVYRKPKPGRSGDEVRQGSRVN